MKHSELIEMPSQNLAESPESTDSGSEKGAGTAAKIAGRSSGVVTFAVDGRPKANRSKNTKSRSGCVTCKKRRIRCDEAKPSCFNCAKSKRECEGYVQKPKASAVPKQVRENRTLLIKPNYESHLFTDQLQKDHFDYWMSFTKDFTLFPSDLMSHLMPQIAREEPAVRHAAFAIGAATMGTHSLEQRTSGQGPFMAQALNHYGKAIQIIRNSEQSKKSLPRALLTCLLFVTFESLQGNHIAALQHMDHGCKILDQVTRQGVAGECPPRLVQEVHDAFRRFTMFAWSLNGYHPEETQTYVPWCCRGRRSRYAIDELPASFDEMVEAQKWWEITQHHIIYTSKMNSGFAFEGLQRDNPERMKRMTSEASKRYLEMMERWRERFKPLMKGAMRQRASNPKIYLQMVSLRLQFLSLEICCKSLYYSDIDYMEKATPAWKAIVSLSRIWLNGQQQSPGPSKEVFTMESSPSWALMLAGVLCFDEEVRNEAHDLMQTYPRRDGLWDSRSYETIIRSTNYLREEAGGDQRLVCQDILANKQLIFANNGIVRRDYRENMGQYEVATERNTPLDQAGEVTVVLR
ncbi:C6 zinc finger domain protein [Colletotrichum karsti]|uniref:C6 zinc finger domain protein n=1 Tax=Colletotrichum karsti TaxID=1095194 RepID=A0A9P6I514_9PEZI|nr:C6 zinc finger domain protein [Colletotrichum karsti]KAF9872110.1 C6 zinc finger domain protein [Colletotrichum karsti]